MPIGAGVCHAGTAPAGFGSPSTASAPSSVMLPDYKTGRMQSGRYLNADTGDYQFTADGRLQGQARVPQLVMIALKTKLASSAIATLGADYSRAAEKGPNFQRQVASIVTNALAALIKQQLVQILSVNVGNPPSNPDASWAWVKWRDLTTGLEETTALP